MCLRHAQHWMCRGRHGFDSLWRVVFCPRTATPPLQTKICLSDVGCANQRGAPRSCASRVTRGRQGAHLHSVVPHRQSLSLHWVPCMLVQAPTTLSQTFGNTFPSGTGRCKGVHRPNPGSTPDRSRARSATRPVKVCRRVWRCLRRCPRPASQAHPSMLARPSVRGPENPQSPVSVHQSITVRQ